MRCVQSEQLLGVLGLREQMALDSSMRQRDASQFATMGKLKGCPRKLRAAARREPFKLSEGPIHEPRPMLNETPAQAPALPARISSCHASARATHQLGPRISSAHASAWSTHESPANA